MQHDIPIYTFVKSQLIYTGCPGKTYSFNWIFSV